MRAIILIVITTFIMTGCTISITMVHTDGEANDIVDENASADVDADLKVPVM